MATVDNERYLRHILLLGEGGLLVLRGIVTREAASRGRTLQNILSCERPNLRTLFREQYSCLFPSSSTVNADVESWDMSLLMVVVKKLFFTTLTQAERTSINTLRTYRVDVQGHPTEMFMGAAEYVTSRADVVAVLRQLSSGINQSSIDEIESIINRTESGNIDILSAMQHIKELHEFKRSLLIELENKFDDTFAKISELDNKLSVIEDVVSKPVQLNDEDSESLRNIQSVQSHLHEDLLDVKSMTNRIDDSSSETHSDMALVKEKLNTLERNDEGRHEELTTHLRRINVNSDESKQAINEIKDVVSKPVQLNDEDCESLRNIQSVQSHLHEDLLDVKCMTDRIDDASSVTHSDVALIKEKLNTLKRNDEDRHEELTTHLRRINMNSDESKQAINEIKDLAARPKDLSEADRNTMKGQELRISIIVQNMNAMKQMLMYQIKRGASKELQTIIEAHCDDFEKQEKATELLYSIIKLVQNEDMFSEKEIRYMIAQRIQWYGYLTLQLIEDVITWFMDMQCNSDASPGYSQLGSIRIPVIYFSSAGLSRFMNYMDSVMCESHLAHISSAVSCLVGFSCSLSWTMESWSIKNERQTLSREVKTTDKEMECKKILLPFQIKSTEGLSHLWDKFGEEKRSGHLVKISDTLSNIFGVDIRVKTSIDTDQFQGALHAEKLYSMSAKMKADRRKMKISRIAGGRVNQAAMGQSWGRKHHESGSGKTQGSLKTEYGVDNEYSGETFPPIEVPDEILYEVLKWVPTEDIVKSCVYVCKQWRNVINIQMFWKEKCIPKLGYTNEIFRFLMDEDFKKLYFKRPYQNNLIKNPDAREEFSHWKIHDNGGDRWRVETPPIEDYTGNKLTKGTLCWVTSYATCSKSQTIDLLERGCSEHVLDDVKPKIHVSEWYAARPDCGIEYRITVQLLRNKEDEIAVKEWTFEDTKPAGRHWFKAEHTFSNYEPGVRFIRYYHEGKDIKFWTGWYGAKMTLSSVILDLKHTSCEASSERSSKTS